MSPPGRAAHHRAHHTHDVPERVEAALARLRADGGRVTTGRRAIVAALYEADDHHVTAEEVADLVRSRHPDVHLSTVYRTLDALERCDVVRRLDLGGDRAVFHLVDHVHHHLVCDRCGTVIEVPDELLAPLAEVVDRRFGFRPADRGLTIAGLCAACR